MKTSRILTNGIIIFLGIGVFFLFMELLGLSKNIYLRLINFVFVIYGVNRTLQQNHDDGNYGYYTNLAAGLLTSVTGLIMSVAAFLIYVSIQGGDTYLEKYHQSYLFGSGNPSMYQFGISLFLEGLAACAITSFTLMQFWKDKDRKINAVDDVNHNSY